MKKLTILVDMDDTIENLLVEWLHILNKRYHCFVTEDDVHSWEITEAYPGLAPAQVYEPLYSSELWESVKPKWDAVEYLRRLQEDGHEIYIVTSSNYKTIHTKLESVLGRYFPYIHMDHVIVCAKKQLIRGDVMIDDGPHNLVGGDYEKLLITAPHNRSYDAALHGMRRVNNWREIYEAIHELS